MKGKAGEGRQVETRWRCLLYEMSRKRRRDGAKIVKGEMQGGMDPGWARYAATAAG